MVVVVDVVVVVVVVFFGAYSLVTGNRARQLRGSTPRDGVWPMDPVVACSGPVLAVACTGAGESRTVTGDVSLHSALMLPLTKVPIPHRAKIPLVP